MNKVIMIGNLTRDLTLNYSQNGTAIAKTGLAVNRRFKGKNGEQKDETMFIDLTIFGRTAEMANQHLNKGKKILVEGRLVLEQWTGQNGQNRSKHSISVEGIEFLDKKDNSNSEVVVEYKDTKGNITRESTMSTVSINEDDIPF